MQPISVSNAPIGVTSRSALGTVALLGLACGVRLAPAAGPLALEDRTAQDSALIATVDSEVDAHNDSFIADLEHRRPQCPMPVLRYDTLGWVTTVQPASSNRLAISVVGPECVNPLFYPRRVQPNEPRLS